MVEKMLLDSADFGLLRHGNGPSCKATRFLPHWAHKAIAMPMIRTYADIIRKILIKLMFIIRHHDQTCPLSFRLL